MATANELLKDFHSQLIHIFNMNLNHLLFMKILLINLQATIAIKIIKLNMKRIG